MLANAGDVVELYQEVLEKHTRQDDTYTLLLTAEYTLNVCAEKFREKYPVPVRRTGEILLMLFEMLEEHPITAGEEYYKHPIYRDILTKERLVKRIADDKWAVRTYLLGEEEEEI